MTPANFGILLALLATALLGATGGLIYRFAQRANQPIRETTFVSPTRTLIPSTPSSNVAIPANWKTYSTNNFTFKYPPSWTLEGGDKNTVLYKPGQGGLNISVGIGISAYNTLSKNAVQITDPVGTRKEVGDKIFEEKLADLIINGKPAAKFKQDVLPGSQTDAYPGFLVRISYDNDTYAFIYLNMLKDQEIDADLQIFEHILPTFKFLISDPEKLLIDSWLQQNNLNQFGDRKDTVYAGGTPLFDERTGERTDRYEYILKKFPDRPWNQ